MQNVIIRKNRIYLTGFMGSGKSTLAPIIANVLGYEHVDIDKAIEGKTGLTISDIFKTHGEAYFRSIERAILVELSLKPNVVVALGGGTVAFNDNLSIMKSSGLLVYLKADPEIIIRRVKRKENRPLLKDEDGTMLTEEALRTRIHTLLTTREQFYLKADIIIEVGNANIPLTVDRIVNKIRKHVDV